MATIVVSHSGDVEARFFGARAEDPGGPLLAFGPPEGVQLSSKCERTVLAFGKMLVEAEGRAFRGRS